MRLRCSTAAGDTVTSQGVAAYRKRPIVIEAMQFTDATKNQVFNWVLGSRFASFDAAGNPTLVISTLEGDMTASLGDWIIRGVKGEFYPCKDNIFTETYERIDTTTLPLLVTCG